MTFFFFQVRQWPSPGFHPLLTVNRDSGEQLFSFSSLCRWCNLRNDLQPMMTHLFSPLLTNIDGGPRELFSMLRLDWRVHWKCQMSMPLSVGYRWLCADSALRGCYRKSCTRMGKSSGRGQSTKKTTSGRGQSFSNLVLFFRLSTNISTLIYYYRSWDGLVQKCQ